jgi:hypothetical protein
LCGFRICGEHSGFNKTEIRTQAKMVRSAGPATHAAGLEEVMRAPPNKGKAKKQYPARITVAAVENPNPICVRDFSATDDGGDEDEAHKVNQQGSMFRKVRNLTNGTLSNTRYEGFFTIYQGPMPEGEEEWFTATLVEHVSEHSFATLKKKFTILPNWRSDDQPHPPFWWPEAEGPALDVVGCAQS